MNKADIAWLAGIIDGEGSVGLARHVNSSGNFRYAPDLQVRMVHQPTIRRIISVLEEMGVQSSELRTPGKGNQTRSFRVALNRLDYVRVVCRAVLPYATTKAKHLGLLAEFCERRLALYDLDANGKVIPRGKSSPPYDERDEAIYLELSRQNRRGSQREPIDNIEWIPSRKLTSNVWNPNVVFTPELRLLEESILSIGWVQPIIVNPNMMIIDGFHRWRLSMDSEPLVQRYAEEVPCAVLDMSDAEAMMLTVRINRAKGTHVAVRLSDVVQELHNDLGCTVDEIMKGCGMGRDEVKLLLAGSLLKTRKLDSYRYSKAWVPIETRRAQKPDDFEREEEVD